MHNGFISAPCKVNRGISERIDGILSRIPFIYCYTSDAPNFSGIRVNEIVNDKCVKSVEVMYRLHVQKDIFHAEQVSTALPVFLIPP